jgi:hypothetical protein
VYTDGKMLPPLPSEPFLCDEALTCQRQAGGLGMGAGYRLLRRNTEFLTKKNQLWQYSVVSKRCSDWRK